MTIEERASEYGFIVKNRGWMPDDLGEEIYTEVATEQRKIDIEKAWSWMMTHVCLHIGDRERFIKAMEE